MNLEGFIKRKKGSKELISLNCLMKKGYLILSPFMVFAGKKIRMRSQTKYQIVLTKTDLVFPIDVARRAIQIEENLKAKKSAVQPVV
ncbi:hypothetical protein LOK49_Contig18G00002 [Camellia lanceoleosa]|nr:hypothetical protein LOK49_Contig18G00002 [Camellia lanceoleosa]